MDLFLGKIPGDSVEKPQEAVGLYFLLNGDTEEAQAAEMPLDSSEEAVALFGTALRFPLQPTDGPSSPFPDLFTTTRPPFPGKDMLFNLHYKETKRKYFH